MTNYESKATVNQSKKAIFEQMSDLSNMEKYKEKFPNNADFEVLFAEDFITAKVPVVGETTIRLVEKNEYENLKFSIENLPMAANLYVKLYEFETDKTEVQLVLETDIPFFLSKIIGDKLQNGLDKIAEIVTATLK